MKARRPIPGVDCSETVVRKTSTGKCKECGGSLPRLIEELPCKHRAMARCKICNRGICDLHSSRSPFWSLDGAARCFDHHY